MNSAHPTHLGLERMLAIGRLAARTWRGLRSALAISQPAPGRPLTSPRI